MLADLFLFATANSVAAWSSVDDRVMGGCSTSCLRYDPIGHAVFEGTVKIDNNGGFASVRTHAMDVGVKSASAYVLKVNSDGKRYKLNLRMDDSFDGVIYQTAFVTPAGVWTSMHLPVSQFNATFRGRPVPEAPSLGPALVRQIGLMIADRQMGDFSLKVRSIGTV
jgi:NADH dehydrogenase [ubiquinone] 1 alpha subcomplex assembly factor 1